MNVGLNDFELNLVRDVFRRHPEVQTVRIFGSRALGTARPNSDIDLALWGEINDERHRAIAVELDDLPLPYLFDVVVYDRIQHPGLKQHIDRYGKIIHKNENNPSRSISAGS